MRIEDVGVGRVTFRLPLTPWLAGLGGTIPLGVLTIPADAAMGCAILTGLPAQTPFGTSELSLRLLRPVPPVGVIRAYGRVIDTGQPLSLAEAEVRDEQDRLIAHGSSLCVTMPVRAPGAASATPATGPEAGGPDPWERDQDDACLEVLTGLTHVHAGGGEATFALPTSPWFCAPPPGRAQGGVVAMLADAALTAAIQTTVPPDVTAELADLKVNYLRPMPTDGRIALARATAIHSGRRIAVAGAEVTDADGRSIAVATGSSVLSAATGEGDLTPA
jgi:uncharacterized protein (TIGR00369 family)